jgi:hypothetical protein
VGRGDGVGGGVGEREGPGHGGVGVNKRVVYDMWVPWLVVEMEYEIQGTTGAGKSVL